jgi:hypothetical protein
MPSTSKASVRVGKGKSGAQPGMHHGPGSSKLQAHAAFIKKELDAGKSYRWILRALMTEEGVSASLGTFQNTR